MTVQVGTDEGTGDGPVGLVIAGAGARGAYEMGALSVLLPWLRSRGETPRIVVGTSAGAMNAVLVAAALEAGDDACTAGLEVWRGIGRASVFEPLLPTSVRSGLRYALGLVGARTRLDGLLDVTPLLRTLEQFEGWPGVHEAVAGGTLDAVAVLATATGAGRAAVRTDVFVEGGRAASAGAGVPPDDDARGVRYRATTLTPAHVLASAAIPVAFPPVRITDPRAGVDGWYLDGGVRLNAPIKPALELGARRVVVVATHPVDDAGPATPAGGTDPEDTPDGPPDVFSAAAAVMTSALVDRMVDDVRSLRRVNRAVAAVATAAGATAAGATAGAAAGGYAQVPYLFVGPTRPGAIADAARAVLDAKYAGPLGGDYMLLNRLVGGSTASHAELLSFLLFDHDFVDELVDLGRRDAAAAIADPDPWAAAR
jgi:NTE family protein